MEPFTQKMTQLLDHPYFLDFFVSCGKILVAAHTHSMCKRKWNLYSRTLLPHVQWLHYSTTLIYHTELMHVGVNVSVSWICVFCCNSPRLGSQLCLWLPSILQVSDQPSADEWSGGLEGKKKRKQNNWFYRHLERVQTGHCQPPRVTGAQRIEKLDVTVSSKTEQSCILQGCFTLVCLLLTMCYHYYYDKKCVLAFELLWSELPLIVPWEEKCILEKTIWLIKDMNKRSYMPCVCFLLHCSQLASNCGIKGMFVSLFVQPRCCVKVPSWSIVSEDCCYDILLPVCVNTDSFFNCQPPDSLPSSLNLGPTQASRVLNTSALWPLWWYFLLSMAAVLEHAFFVLCVWGYNSVSGLFQPDGSGKTTVHLMRGVSFPGLIRTHFWRETSGITNCIKTNFWLQSCVEESCCLSVGLCVAECVPVFLQWKCCVRNTLVLCWLCCGLHTGPLFCPELPLQRDLRWVNSAFSGLQIVYSSSCCCSLKMYPDSCFNMLFF